jgi:hypothetical protein
MLKSFAIQSPSFFIKISIEREHCCAESRRHPSTSATGVVADDDLLPLTQPDGLDRCEIGFVIADNENHKLCAVAVCGCNTTYLWGNLQQRSSGKAHNTNFI